MSAKPTTTLSQMSCLILSQNGVVDRETHYSPGLHVPAVEMGSAMDSLRSSREPNGNIRKRPTNLSPNGFVAKSLQEIDADDGSLPCTPEQHSDSETDGSGGHAGDRALDTDTRGLISSFLRDFTGLTKRQWHRSKPQTTMKTVVEDVLSKHIYAYNGMIKKLDLDNQPDDMGFVSSVARSLFADGITNWGRIASLVAFGAVVCQNLRERGRDHCVDIVSEEISTYLLKNQRDWLIKNNSWDGFVEFFRVADPESTVRNTLLAFVGAAGIGATLAFLIR